MSALSFKNKPLEPPPTGSLMQISAKIRRVVCHNASHYTSTGTCCYIIGTGEVAVIDPGPEDASFRQKIRTLLEKNGEQIAYVMATHTHHDHSTNALPLANETGAMLVGAGPHRLARPLFEGEINPLAHAADHSYIPDRELKDDEEFITPSFTLRALATPGHCANHLAFALEEDNILLCGDHVMAWSSTLVAPPDGALKEYLEATHKLLKRPETLYLPGHGAEITNPKARMEFLLQHRQERENAVISALQQGLHSIHDIADQLYVGLAPHLREAALMTLTAHLEYLVETGRARCQGPPLRTAHFSLA